MTKALCWLLFMVATACTGMRDVPDHYYEVASSGERTEQYLRSADPDDSVNLYLYALVRFPPPITYFAHILVERPEAVDAVLRRIKVEESPIFIEHLMYALVSARIRGTLSYERVLENRQAIAQAAERVPTRSRRIVDFEMTRLFWEDIR